MRKIRWTLGPQDSRRCTETVLNQFGIFGKTPRTGDGVIAALVKAGWALRSTGWSGDTPFRGTVRQFCEERPTGRFYFATDGHALALIDGLLVDSSGKGPDDRQVIGAVEVVPTGVWRRS